MPGFMEWQVNKVQEGFSGIVARDRFKNKYPSPDKSTEKENDPAAEIEGICFFFNSEDEVFQTCNKRTIDYIREFPVRLEICLAGYLPLFPERTS